MRILSIRNNLVLLLLIFVSNISRAQKSEPQVDNVFLISSNIVNNVDQNMSTNNPNQVGFTFEYRRNIKSFTDKLNLSLGLGMEIIPLKEEFDDGDHIDKFYNIIIPFNLNYRFTESFYAGLILSFDFPLAERNKIYLNGDVLEYNDFIPQYLNLHLSNGVKLGKSFNFKNSKFILEIHLKLLATIAAKSNDYWVYPEESNLFYYGLSLGYGF